MKITFPDNYGTFDDLGIGDVFRLNENICMRTCTVSTTNEKINTVNLETGRFSLTNGLTEVEKLNGEYIIK